MPTEYKINLVNLTSTSQLMWCFLSEPESTISEEVYANSNTNLNVPPSTGKEQNSFTIPLQYSVQAGASNNAVGLNIQITSSVTESTDLGVGWLASYTQDSVNTPPTLETMDATLDDELAITTNIYEKEDEPINSWYGSMTYGVQSSDGFIGITWSPTPATTYQIKPKVTFYVAIGDFSTNTLADINTISSSAAVVTEADFDRNNECTVTRNSDGSWVIEPGNTTPTSLSAELILLNSHLNLSSAHNELVKLVSRENRLKLPVNQA